VTTTTMMLLLLLLLMMMMIGTSIRPSAGEDQYFRKFFFGDVVEMSAIIFHLDVFRSNHCSNKQTTHHSTQHCTVVLR